MSFDIRIGPAAAHAAAAPLSQLVDDLAATGLTAQDPTLWGPQSTDHARAALGWVTAVSEARPLVSEIAALREALRIDGVDRIVLAACGAIAAAARLIAETESVPLTVLETTAPEAVLDALHGGEADAVSRTALVVCATGMPDPEVGAVLQIFETAFGDVGIDPAQRIIIVAPEGSPLDRRAREHASRVVAASPTTDARFSALSAYALVPAGLAGADIGELLDEADATLLEVAIDSDENPAIVLAAALAGSAVTHPSIGVLADGTHLRAVEAWVDQLLAAATGDDGGGILPFALLPVSPEVEDRPADVRLVRVVDEAFQHPLFERHEHDILVSGSLGGQIVVWHHATALLCRVLGIDPFRPSAFEALDLDGRPAQENAHVPAPSGLRVRPALGSSGASEDVSASLAELCAAVADHGRLDVHAFADPHTFSQLSGLREMLAARTGRPVSFRWAPGCLRTHPVTTGGSPALLQLVALTGADVQTAPDAPTAAEIMNALALADARAHQERGLPVLTLALSDAASDVLSLFDAAQ